MANVEEVSRSTSPSTAQAYWQVLVRRVWGLPKSAHYSRKVAPDCMSSNRGPVGFHCDGELLSHIVASTRTCLLLGKATEKCGPGFVFGASEHPLCDRFD